MSQYLSETFISVDVEASGPIPGEYSLLSIGACVVGGDQTFYRELKPIADKYLQRALEVSGLSLEKLRQEGTEPSLAMQQFAAWIDQVKGSSKSVFVGFNATFDWMFVTYYFHRFLGRNPFGVSGLDIKAYYMGKFGTTWQETAKKQIKRRIPTILPHTHNSLDDAREQAEIFEQIRGVESKDLTNTQK